MNSSEIKSIVENDLAGAADENEIRKNLINPEIEKLIDFNDETHELWIVAKIDEYCIVYNEKEKEYGVAVVNILHEKTFLGLSGTIADAYQDIVNEEQE